MMSTTVELLLRIKPEWERAYSEFLSEGQEPARISSKDVSRLLEVMLESHLTGESKRMRQLLEEWIESPKEDSLDPMSFDIYQKSSLIGSIHVLRAILLHTAQQGYAGEDLASIQSAIEQFFGAAVEYIAYTEATQNLLRAQRRQKEVQDALERLDESRANFVSIAAHGLKTPLTLVEGYSKMLGEQLEPDAEEAKPLLAGIESGTERMRELIDDLVDVALIDNKMLSLYYQPLRMPELIESVIDEFSDQLEAKGINLQKAWSEEFDQTVYADQERIAQALVEVIDNAIKFTPNDGLIHIQGRTLPGFIEVSITDNGVGIAPEDQTRIFEQFSAVSDQANPQSESYQSLSSGLGLHLCKGILEAHGGAVWVDSPGYDPERCPGSIFHLMIPARTEPPDDLSVRLLGKPRV